MTYLVLGLALGAAFGWWLRGEQVRAYALAPWRMR